MRDAGVYSTRDLGELNAMLYNLSQEGYRIVTVLQTPNEMFHVIAQREVSDART